MKTTVSIVAAAAALLATPLGHAQAYVGAGIGPSKIKIDCSGAVTCDRTDTGFKVYGGWHLAGPFALEAVYFDWGKAEAAALPSSGGANDLRTKARGLGLGGAYFLPLAWGECVARLGVARNRAKTTATEDGLVASGTFNLTAPYFGFGCAYRLAPWGVLTADVDFSRIRYTSQDKAQTQLFTLGLRF